MCNEILTYTMAGCGHYLDKATVHVTKCNISTCINRVRDTANDILPNRTISTVVDQMLTCPTCIKDAATPDAFELFFLNAYQQYESKSQEISSLHVVSFDEQARLATQGSISTLRSAPMSSVVDESLSSVVDESRMRELTPSTGTHIHRGEDDAYMNDLPTIASILGEDRDVNRVNLPSIEEVLQCQGNASVILPPMQKPPY